MKDFKTDRLNFDVVLYRGCTLKELLQIGFLSFFVCFICSVLFTLSFFGSFTWSFVPTLIISPFVGKGILARLQMLKRDKPYAYYEHVLQLKFAKYGFSCPYLRRSGLWAIERR